MIVCAAAPASARAQNDIQQQPRLTRPLAPWMALDETMKNRRPDPDTRAMAPLKMNHAQDSAHAPRDPVITPDSTVEMIAQLYDDAQTAKPSALEDAYARRIMERPAQFGYDIFGAVSSDDKNAQSPALPAGMAQDDFMLNGGDRVTIAFRGQRQDSKTYAINAQGQLLIDDLPPISAAGRTIGQLGDSLQAEADKLYNTQIYLTLESVRQVNITIIGHVEKPGRQTLTVFDSVLDALSGAGGVRKTGSLRQIKLVRDGRSMLVDLYGLLIHGSPIMDISLRDGDRIIVPPIGPTVAVAGNVKQPGIFEILPELRGGRHKPLDRAQRLSLEEMLSLSGGVLNPGQNRFIKLSLNADGREETEDVKDDMKPVFTDGSILMVAMSEEERTGVVELSGHTRRPGIHALDQSASLSALLNSDRVMGPDVYPLLAVIERRDADQLTPELIAFPPLLALRGEFDRRLQDGDVVRLFSRQEILDLRKERDAKDVTKDKKEEPEEEYGSALEGGARALADDPVMVSFLKERSAFIRGAVRQEGGWPVAEGVTLANIMAAAGGVTLEADTNNIEVTSRLQGEGHQEGARAGLQRLNVSLKDSDPASVMIGPGDTVRVSQKFKRVEENSVLLIGEVANPGRYDLMAGDKMSDLLARAGGLTNEAYPDGAIFSRESERKAEEMRFRAQAQDLEIKLAAALEQDGEKAPDMTKIAAVKDLVVQLRQAEALGRITVESDPAALSVEPELDILLESGDRIYIPKRPLTVRVAGEVLSPANLQFRKEKDPRDYIAQAGGFTYNADKDRVFVLFPDGSAQPLAVNSWNHTPALIPPGSSVVVPRDPKPFDFIETAKDVSQILSNLAITSIFIDDIRDDE